MVPCCARWLRAGAAVPPGAIAARVVPWVWEAGWEARHLVARLQCTVADVPVEMPGASWDSCGVVRGVLWV